MGCFRFNGGNFCFVHKPPSLTRLLFIPPLFLSVPKRGRGRQVDRQTQLVCREGSRPTPIRARDRVTQWKRENAHRLPALTVWDPLLFFSTPLQFYHLWRSCVFYSRVLVFVCAHLDRVQLTSTSLLRLLVLPKREDSAVLCLSLNHS